MTQVKARKPREGAIEIRVIKGLHAVRTPTTFREAVRYCAQSNPPYAEIFEFNKGWQLVCEYTAQEAA
jgi:hypothetical protein